MQASSLRRSDECSGLVRKDVSALEACYAWPPPPRRDGKILVLFAVLLPVLLGIVGLVIDGGLSMAEYRQVQHIADAAATAAAMDKLRGFSDTTAVQTATAMVREHNELADADVTVHIPPREGAYRGEPKHVEVIVRHRFNTSFIQVLGGSALQRVRTRAVAGYEPTTAGTAVMALDPDPPGVALPALSSLVSPLPAQLGGIEVLGAGQLRVDGAVLANTEWGGVDQGRNPAGDGPGPPYGLSSTPVIGTSKLRAKDIRVVGGVDDPSNYGHIDSGEPSPLQANKLPMPDPLRYLPVPNESNVDEDSDEEHGGVRIVTGGLLGGWEELEPGIYEWIEIVSGRVQFEPGVYIIRGVNPVTGIALNILGGQVRARGVMFYITNNPSYTLSNTSPDANDGNRKPSQSATPLLPSVVLNAGLAGSRFRPLNDSDSPFDGMLIYQRRHDRRPIVIVQSLGFGSGRVQGTVYAKWAPLILEGKGTYRAQFVVGSLRVIETLSCRIEPVEPLPPVEEVFLVE